MKQQLKFPGLTQALVTCLAAAYLMPAPALARTPAELRIPDGTPLTLTLQQPLSSELNHAGDRFGLFVAEAVTVNGRVVVRAGTQLEGVVTVARPCGRLARQGRLGIELAALRIGRQEIPVAALHGAAARPKSDVHGVVHGVTGPVRDMTNNFIAGFGDTPSALQSPVPPAGARAINASLKKDVLDTDPLDRVELSAPLKARLLQRGLTGLERFGTNTANVFFGGPLGLFRRGAAIEVPAGTTVHAVTDAAAERVARR